MDDEQLGFDGPDFGQSIGICSSCGESRESEYTCRAGGHTVLYDQELHAERDAAREAALQVAADIESRRVFFTDGEESDE